MWGADQVVRAKGVALILASDTINRTSRGELQRLADSRHIPLVWVDDKLLRESTHKLNCKCVGITDVNLAKATLSQLTRIGEEKE